MLEGRPVSHTRRVRIEAVLVDLATGVLQGPRGVSHLAPKLVRLLRRLLETAPSVVTKEELIAAVWGEEPVSDSALTQSVLRLRRLLGDDSRRPVFIRTIPGRGYALVAPMREAPTSAPADPPTTPPARQEILVVPGEGNAMELRLLLSTIEGTVEQAGDFALTKKSRATWAMRFLRLPEGRQLTPAEAAALARREGGASLALILSVRTTGHSRSIEVLVVDAATAETVHRLSHRAPGGARLAAACRTAAGCLVEWLHSAGVPASSRRAWPDVTTSSLDALEAFARALTAAETLRWGQARDLLESAVRSDPEFAAAWAWLAIANVWLERPEDASAAAKCAGRLTAHVSPPERHFARAVEASFFGELRDVIDHLELLVEECPTDFWGAFRLAEAYLAAGRVDDSLRMRAHCAKLRPDHVLNHAEAGFARLFAASDLSGAAKEYAEVLRLDPHHPFALPHLAGSFQLWMSGDLRGARRAMDRFLEGHIGTLLPLGRASALVHDARLRLYCGDARGALASLDAALEGVAPASTLDGWIRIERALTLRDLGEGESFLSQVEALARTGTPLNRAHALLWRALHAAAQHDYEASRQCMVQLSDARGRTWKEFGLPASRVGERIRHAFPALIQAEMALQQGDAALALGLFAEAAEVLPLALDAPVPLVTVGPRAHFAALEGKARALAAAGREEDAIAAEDSIQGRRMELLLLTRAGTGCLLASLARRAALHARRGDLAPALADAREVLTRWGNLAAVPEPVALARQVLEPDGRVTVFDPGRRPRRGTGAKGG